MATSFVEYATLTHPLLDLRTLLLGYLSPLGAVGLGMAISAWKRAPDWRPPGPLAGTRRSVAVIGVITMIVAVFDMFSRAFEYESHFNLGLFGLPVFCAGLLVWWLAIRRGR